MKDVSFHAGDVVFREDEMQLSMYEVRKGSVGIYLDYGTEQERQLTVLKEKQLFGEMGLLEAAPRSATAVVLSDIIARLRVIVRHRLIVSRRPDAQDPALTAYAALGA